MAENLMNSDHKATNPKYRQEYDRIKWNGDKKKSKDKK